MRGDNQQRRESADPDTQNQQESVLREDQPRDRGLLESQGLQQGQLSPALEHAANHDHGQAERPEEQPEPSQSAKGAQIRVLHDEEPGHAIRRAHGVKALVGECRFQRCPDIGRGGLHQQGLVPAVVRKEFQEPPFGQQQFGLKNAPREQACQNQASGLARAVLYDQFVAQP